MIYPWMIAYNEKPPTLYSILESIVNYGKDEKTKIRNLADTARTTIFDFNYPLSQKISKADFEKIILNKFMMRRIGFETVTAFQLSLEVKLNEIMPLYNKMFDSLPDDIFSGETTTINKQGSNNSTRTDDLTRTDDFTTNSTSLSSGTTTGADTTTNNNTSTNSTTNKFSNLPQNEISDINNGNYMTEYTKNDNTSTDNNTVNANTSTNVSNNLSNDVSNYGTQKNTGTQKNNTTTSDSETITKSLNKLDNYLMLQDRLKNIYSLIFDDLDELFYQLY